MGEAGVVQYRVDNRIARITLNRPHVLNAINDQLRRELTEQLLRFEGDADAEVAILSGNGRAFCAGADLKEMAEKGRGEPIPGATPHIGRNLEITKPTIAQVHGVAYAGGFLLAQMCDLCVAADDAKFGLPEVTRGRGAPWATPLIWMLPQRVMMEMLMTGQPFPAQRLHQLGFVNAICPLSALADTAESLAGVILRNSPLSVRAGRRITYIATDAGRGEALSLADRAFEPVYASADALEGPRAFAEGRTADWESPGSV